jgi:hypothetical protein
MKWRVLRVFSSGQGTRRDNFGARDGVISLIFSIRDKNRRICRIQICISVGKGNGDIVRIHVQSCHSSKRHKITNHTRRVFLTVGNGYWSKKNPEFLDFWYVKKIYIVICELHSMSKLFVLVLLAAFLIPAGVFAASPDSPLGSINASVGTCVLGTGNTAACGMMTSGADICSRSNVSACDCGDDCAFGMMGRNQESSATSSYGMMDDNRGIAGTSGYGMMGGSWGQATGGGAGRYGGWAALGFILVITLIIVWIIVGILLIFNLYRKLSTK